jgi:metal-responsive CopG/Arc/MetJ family transcriptional regulator
MAGLTKPVEDRGMTIPVVLPNALLARVNEAARDRGISRSAVIRAALSAALIGDGPSRDLTAAASARPDAEDGSGSMRP